MPVNSRNKGARGEREAAKYLTKLGFNCHRNGRNGYSSDDLVCESLPRVHIEVKYGYDKMDVGTKLLADAWEQAAEHSGPRAPVVLWKPKQKLWRLTWWSTAAGCLTTASGDYDIERLLERMDAGEVYCCGP